MEFELICIHLLDGTSAPKSLAKSSAKPCLCNRAPTQQGVHGSWGKVNRMPQLQSCWDSSKTPDHSRQTSVTTGHCLSLRHQSSSGPVRYRYGCKSTRCRSGQISHWQSQACKESMTGLRGIWAHKLENEILFAHYKAFLFLQKYKFCIENISYCFLIGAFLVSEMESRKQLTKACHGPLHPTCHISVLHEQLHLHIPSFPNALSLAVTWIGLDLPAKFGTGEWMEQVLLTMGELGFLQARHTGGLNS